MEREFHAYQKAFHWKGLGCRDRRSEFRKKERANRDERPANSMEWEERFVSRVGGKGVSAKKEGAGEGKQGDWLAWM